MTDEKQSEAFKQAARDLECDPDEKAWDERLKKIAKAEPTDSDKPQRP